MRVYYQLSLACVLYLNRRLEWARLSQDFCCGFDDGSHLRISAAELYSLQSQDQTPKVNASYNHSFHKKIQSTLGFATMGKAANLGLTTRNAMTDLF